MSTEIITRVQAALDAMDNIDESTITQSAGMIRVLYKGLAKQSDVYAALHFGPIGKAVTDAGLTLLVFGKN